MLWEHIANYGELAFSMPCSAPIAIPCSPSSLFSDSAIVSIGSVSKKILDTRYYADTIRYIRVVMHLFVLLEVLSFL